MKRIAADVILRLLRTEKGTRAAGERKYFFRVDVHATKPQIRQAVEETFKVKVDKVRTAVFSGKPRRVGAQWGYRPNWKKAVVTLGEGSAIEVTH